MHRFCIKLVSFHIVSQRHYSFDKHTSLLQIPYITNLQCLYIKGPKSSLELHCLLLNANVTDENCLNGNYQLEKKTAEAV